MPEKPRYMHQATYERHLLRFLRHREKHSDRMVREMVRDMAKIVGLFK